LCKQEFDEEMTEEALRARYEDIFRTGDLDPCVTFSKGACFYDRLNSLQLVIEPVLFIHFHICGQFWGKTGKFGRNWPIKKYTDLDFDANQSQLTTSN
jgi:hypothetical protein